MKTKNNIKHLIFGTFLLIIMLSPSLIQAAAPIYTNPFVSSEAVRGGQLNLYTSDFPKSFNYFIENTVDSYRVFSLMYETLMELHPVTLEFQPLLAKSWDISDDKKEFTIKLDPKAKWEDGKPVTTADIKFTYDTIMNPKNMTPVQRMDMSRFYPPVIIDKYTVKFKAKTVHYNNLISVASFMVLPKHLFEGKDFNKSFNLQLPSGSGPYKLKEVRPGRYFVLERKKCWSDMLPLHQGMFNFDRIKVKVIRNEDVAYEAFKKGEFDVYTAISSKRWVKESDGKQFKNNWIIKQKVFNSRPEGIAGLAINMRRPIFQDRRVRLALAHLLDRKTLIEKIMFNQYKPLNSYWPSLFGMNANQPIEYNPDKAKELLKEAGYNSLDSAGYLINKKGERLEFTISYIGESWEKHLTMYVDTCKQAGVKVNLELLSYASFMKKKDEYKFDMALSGWSATLFPDPEQLWHSKHAEEIGASNLSGYKNPEVDRLIDSLPPIFDVNKRNEIIRKIDRMIYNDVPYILFWGSDYNRVFYKNIFGRPKTILSKYGDDPELDIICYWWFDQTKLKQYKNAIAKNKPLVSEPEEIFFDQVFKK